MSDDLRTIRIRDLTLAYRVWDAPGGPGGPGGPAAPALVLLHSLGADSGDWAAVAAGLAPGRRVYALDLRGHGGSDWPGEYGFELFRDDAAAFIEALGAGPVDLAGHSLGGAAAQLLAARHPELVERLVLEEVPVLVPADPPQTATERPEDPGFDWKVKLRIVEERNSPDPRWWELTGAITAPTLLIAGGPASHLPQHLFKDLADRIPDCRLITVADGGHLVHATRPAEFTAAVSRFLARPALPGAAAVPRPE